MRPETGTMQFEGDWRGVFIRGDSAFNYAMHLERLMKHQPPGDVIGMMVVRDLHNLLIRSDERGPAPETQRMRPYADAIANKNPDDCAPTLDHGQSPDRGES